MFWVCLLIISKQQINAQTLHAVIFASTVDWKVSQSGLMCSPALAVDIRLAKSSEYQISGVKNLRSMMAYRSTSEARMAS